MRKRNDEIKRILADFKNSLNGSITKKNNEILVIIVAERRHDGETIWSQVPKGTNTAAFANLCRNELKNAEYLLALLKKNHVIKQAIQEQPSGKLIVRTVGKNWIFAALVSLKSDMSHIFPAMEKTAEELAATLSIQ